MQIEVNKDQLELLKYAILWYECNDEEEERSAAIRRSPLINEEKDVIINTILNRLINSLNAN